MTELSFGVYARALSELLSQTRATDDSAVALSLDQAAERAAAIVVGVRTGEHKLLLVGNGGSAAIVSHLHSDLEKSAGVRALVFHDVPLLTAITNDDGYERVFADPVRRWAEPGDALIAVSSSGRSPNILRAVRAAQEGGAVVLTLSGFDADNPLAGMGVLNFHVPSHDYGMVEAAHTALTHFISDRATRLGRDAP